MPTVHYALTHAVKRLWADYWAMRPTATPLNLEDVLDQCRPVEDHADYDFEPADGAGVWEHPDIPDHAFIVKDSGVEWVVTRMVPKKRNRVLDLMKKKPKPAPAAKVVHVAPPPTVIVHEAMPDIGEEPPGTAQEKWAWAKKSVAELSTWLSRNTKLNPNYLKAVELNTLLMRKGKGFRLQVERQAEEDAQYAESPDAFETDGKLNCIPAVRWLLKQVVELKAKVAELETRHGGNEA